MDFKEFGKKISQEILAKDIGISRATLSSFENCRGVDIGFKKVLQIVDYLGYSLNMKEITQFPTFDELQDRQ